MFFRDIFLLCVLRTLFRPNHTIPHLHEVMISCWVLLLPSEERGLLKIVAQWMLPIASLLHL